MHGYVKVHLTDRIASQTLEYKSLTLLPNIYLNDIIWWWGDAKLGDKLQRT
jgi:hypothetical protein